MSIKDQKRTRAVKCALLFALVWAGTGGIVACSNGPQAQSVDQRGSQVAANDPIEGLPQPGAAGASKDKKPAAPATPVVTEAQLDIPFYPGATPYVEPGSIADMSSSGPGMTAVVLETHDPVASVVEFYQNRLAGKDDTGKPDAPTKTESQIAGKPAVTVSRVDGRTVKAAEIRQSDNITIIELMRMEAPKPGNLPGNIPGRSESSPAGTAPGGTPSGMAMPGASSMPGSLTTPGEPAGGTKPRRRSLDYP